MAKEFVGVRLPVELDDKLNEIAKENTESKTDTIIRALRQFVEGDTDRLTLQDVNERVDRLEAKIKDITNSGEPSRTKTSVDYSDKGDAEPKNDELINPDDLPELITEKQAAAMTGYSTSTLSSKRSKHDIYAKKRVDGNRAGLYSKKEILSRIGIK